GDSESPAHMSSLFREGLLERLAQIEHGEAVALAQRLLALAALLARLELRLVREGVLRGGAQLGRRSRAGDPAERVDGGRAHGVAARTLADLHQRLRGLPFHAGGLRPFAAREQLDEHGNRDARVVDEPERARHAAPDLRLGILAPAADEVRVARRTDPPERQ